ncbi:hypothetical protein Aduo_015320 [Ancylostoma duodenale]
MPRGLSNLVEKYEDVFAVSELELSSTDLIEHDIDVGDAKPIEQRTRPLSYAMKVEVDNMLSDLKERNIIEDSHSPWASPIVLVAKKDGTVRLCVDYREVNKVTKKDSYPLPGIDVTLQNLKGKKFFSSLDLASGYWQVPLTEKAKEISAFTTTSGLFQFRVLPFGLTTAPAVFQRLMEKVLGKLIGTEVAVYIDDVLVATDSEERHYEVLAEVLEAFRNASLRLKPQKCRLMECTIDFLGHIVDAEGVRTSLDKVQRILEYPRPQNIAQLRAFLGLAGYYRKFVYQFASIAKPLYELTSSKVTYTWGDIHEKAFATLKKVLSSAPVLAQPDIEKARSGERPFIIYKDASGVGVGAVLAQRGEDGLLHPLHFASKPLSRAERNYHITDQEALAVIYALKKFHYFVYGVRTVVRTDHSPLTTLFKRANVSPRILRWALEIQRYNVSIEYVKGTANLVADALSRGIAETSFGQPTHAEDERVVAKIGCSEWLAELRADDDFKAVVEAVEQGKYVEVKLPRHEKTLNTADFVIEDDRLKLIAVDGSLLDVIPKSKRHELFKEAHEGTLAAHFSARNLVAQLKKRVFWPGMQQDIVKWSREYQRCFLSNTSSGKTPPLKPITTSRPFEVIGVDLIEMGLTSRGNRYIVTVIDHFTKYLGAYPVPDKRAETVAEAIFGHWICAAGRWPEAILSDRGLEFENSIMSALCDIMNIKQLFTKGYCPRENGLTERANGTLVSMLRKKTVVPAEWDKILPAVVYAYKALPHSATGESPHFLLYGHDPRYPSEVIPRQELSAYMVDYDQYKVELLSGLKLARECIREHSEKYKARMKEFYGRRWKTDKSTSFNPGDRVYVMVPTEKGKSKHPKLTMGWTGPYRVIEASANSALVTEIGANKEPLRVQFDHLVKIPPTIDDTPVKSKCKRVPRRGRPAKVPKATKSSSKL